MYQLTIYEPINKPLFRSFAKQFEKELIKNPFQGYWTYLELTYSPSELRKVVLQSGFDKVAKSISKSQYFSDVFNQTGEMRQGYTRDKLSQYDALDSYLQNQAPRALKVAKNANHNKYKSAGRLKSKIEKMANFSLIYQRYLIFGTLTFSESTLHATSEATRRQMVYRSIKRASPYYIANIDYGDKEKNPNSNEREHYHFVAVVPKCELDKKGQYYRFKDPTIWSDFYKLEKVNLDELDYEKIAKYITKLTSHAIKQSTKLTQRLIYSRDLKQINALLFLNKKVSELEAKLQEQEEKENTDYLPY